MRKIFAILVTLLCLGGGLRPGIAQEQVHFPSLADNGPGAAPTMLDGYLYRPGTSGPHPAVVALHGCGGLISAATGFILKREQAWAAELIRQGYIVLFVDSFRPRNHGEMCSVEGFDLDLYRKRPKDAYGALAYLQAQDFVRPDRIGMIGWSQGGGVVLLSIGNASLGRPPVLSGPDFRAAVAFYPGSCNEARLPAGWVNIIPLFVLVGAEDVWTPLAPCQAVLGTAASRGGTIAMQAYPGAYHDFDAPDLARQELAKYRTRAGVLPIVATDPAARADAFARVPAFLARYLLQ